MQQYLYVTGFNQRGSINIQKVMQNKGLIIAIKYYAI